MVISCQHTLRSNCESWIHAKKIKPLILFPGKTKTPLPTDEAEELKRALHATVSVLFHHTNKINVTFRAGKWKFQMV